MLVLYVDSYRGFANTYIPIKDVNFLIGENSTGKTSILSLLYLLSEPRFWFGQEFNTEEVQLGTFRDIVSIKSEKKKFRVGLIDFKDEPGEMGAYLLTFTEEDDLPIISRYDYYTNKKEVSIVFTNKRTSYRIKQTRLKGKKQKAFLSMFQTWTRQKDTKTGFRDFKKKPHFPRKGSLVFVPSFIESLKRPRKNTADKLTFGIPEPFGDFAWIAPIRSEPKRTYDEFKLDFTAEGGHTPYLIKRLLSSKIKAKKFKKFLSQFGRRSDLFDSMVIRTFGSRPTSPFALNVVLEGKPLNIKNVGYGVSQCLPVIVELFAREGESWFAIQQPEIHLHPKAQAALGDTIFNLAIVKKKKFLIETHTDYIVDRFRLNYGKKKESIDSQVLYFERTAQGNKVYPIEIMGNGEYSDKQPKSFRKFFVLEELKLLGMR